MPVPRLRPRPRRTRSVKAPPPGALNVPEGYSVQRLSNPESRDSVTSWLRQSPDHTLYHLGPFIDFTRAEHDRADVFLVSRAGYALFALAVHSWTGMGVDSGYSGVAFPPTRGEGPLRRSVTALAELLAANGHLTFRFHQSAQATAYDDPGRVTLLARLLEGAGLVLDPIYGRLCPLDGLPGAGQIPTTVGRDAHALTIDADWLTGDSVRAYDPDTRNQIRQAVRRGLTVEFVRAADPEARASAYARFQPLHEESWTRTGLIPKTPDYWTALSGAITTSGGEDLVVLALGPGGEPLAGVLCHAYQSRAIYWSGCSSTDGLRSRANPLCLHGAIAACRQVGVGTFELGRFRADESSKKQRAITAYKAQFGGELMRITTFAPIPGVAARARTVKATAVFEARRRLAVAAGRVRARSAATLPVP